LATPYLTIYFGLLTAFSAPLHLRTRWRNLLEFRRRPPVAGSGRQRKLPGKSMACRGAYGSWSTNSPSEHQRSLLRKRRRT